MGRAFLIVLIGLTWFYTCVGFVFWDAYWYLKLPNIDYMGRFLVFYIVSVIFAIGFLFRKRNDNKD